MSEAFEVGVSLALDEALLDELQSAEHMIAMLKAPSQGALPVQKLTELAAPSLRLGMMQNGATQTVARTSRISGAAEVPAAAETPPEVALPEKREIPGASLIAETGQASSKEIVVASDRPLIPVVRLRGTSSGGINSLGTKSQNGPNSKMPRNPTPTVRSITPDQQASPLGKKRRANVPSEEDPSTVGVPAPLREQLSDAPPTAWESRQAPQNGFAPLQVRRPALIDRAAATELPRITSGGRDPSSVLVESMVAQSLGSAKPMSSAPFGSDFSIGPPDGGEEIGFPSSRQMAPVLRSGKGNQAAQAPFSAQSAPNRDDKGLMFGSPARQTGGQRESRSDQSSGGGSQIQGDVYLDGAIVGRWISRLLTREVERSNASPNRFDSRRGRLLPGPTVR